MNMLMMKCQRVSESEFQNCGVKAFRSEIISCRLVKVTGVGDRTNRCDAFVERSKAIEGGIACRGMLHPVFKESRLMRTANVARCETADHFSL
jgi:hypothetical protein